MRDSSWGEDEVQAFAGAVSPRGIFKPGTSAADIKSALLEYAPELSQNVICICISSTLVLLKLLYFLSVEHVCWDVDATPTQNTHNTDLPEFHKPSWEAILIINYSRPPNHWYSPM